MRALRPFAPAESLHVQAGVIHAGQCLKFSFDLATSEGLLDGPIPGHWATWPRADELWQTTCFEAFWGVPGHSEYRELNLSPSRLRWNIYAFSGYRFPVPPRPDPTFELSDLTVTETSLTCTLSSSRLPPVLECSLASVVRTKSGVSYFALIHGGERPDFHQRQSFVGRLDASSGI